MINELKISQENLLNSEKIRAITGIAIQLAHDIRSPLAVMEMTLMSLSKQLPQENINIQKEAIQRVRDIDILLG